MGIDYNGVGGIGVEFDDVFVEAGIKQNLFTQEEWDDDPDNCLDVLNMEYQTAGNHFTGDVVYYLLVDGKSLSEVNANADRFCGDIKAKLCLELTPDELGVISDICVW
jgi:hypothetical protein